MLLSVKKCPRILKLARTYTYIFAYIFVPKVLAGLQKKALSGDKRKPLNIFTTSATCSRVSTPGFKYTRTETLPYIEILFFFFFSNFNFYLDTEIVNYDSAIFLRVLRDFSTKCRFLK